MYPTLHRLLDNGYISDERVQVGKRMSRVYYHMEPKGRDYLREMVSEYHIFTNGLENILSFCNFSSEVDKHEVESVSEAVSSCDKKITPM